MSECIKEGTIVLTIAIVVHGQVIALDLTPETLHMMDDVRMFSMAGDLTYVVCEDSIRNQYASKLYPIFREDLDQGSGAQMREYTQRLKSKYREYVETFFKDLQDTNMCQVYKSVTFDKEYVEDKSNPTAGIFLVSVHIKTKTALQLLFPPQQHLLRDSATSGPFDVNLMTIDGLKQVNDVFNTGRGDELVAKLMSASSAYPAYHLGSSSDAKAAFREKVDKWMVTMDKGRGDISRIRLSYLVYILKYIVTGMNEFRVNDCDCKINVFDYSCFSLHESIVDSDGAKYVNEEDVETGITKWG